jgi:hypothetical protein
VPRHVFDPEVPVAPAGLDEQPVAQPVQVPNHQRRDGALFGQRHGEALGAPADGPRQVKAGGGFRAAGEDELAQRRELPLGRVDLRLQPRRDRLF